jgi:phosphatidate cytidylyltransferase
MSSKFSNLIPRLITALLGAAGIVFGIVFSEWTYFAIFFIICLFSLIEFYKLAGLDGMVPQKHLVLFAGCPFSACLFLLNGATSRIDITS